MSPHMTVDHFLADAVESPKVSVLIPTFNYARYLPEAIESVLAQDLEDFELVISDDCSTDNSAEIIAHFAAKDRRLHFTIHRRRLGMVQNWNWCLSQVRAPYAKIVFGDDRLASRSTLSQLVALLDAHPSAVIASSPRFLIDENSQVIKVQDSLGKAGLHQGTKVIERCLVRDENLVGEPSIVLFRTAAARRGFNENYRQLVDVEMWCHLLERGDLIYAPQPLSCFRRHRQQQTELNRTQLVGIKEAIKLALQHQSKPYLGKCAVRQILGNQLYAIRTCRRKRGVEPDEEMKRCARELTAQLGQAFWMTWIRRRTIRPLENLFLRLLRCRHWGRQHFAIAEMTAFQAKAKHP
jgi:hypothetical protein